MTSYPIIYIYYFLFFTTEWLHINFSYFWEVETQHWYWCSLCSSFARESLTNCCCIHKASWTTCLRKSFFPLFSTVISALRDLALHWFYRCESYSHTCVAISLSTGPSSQPLLYSLVIL